MAGLRRWTQDEIDLLGTAPDSEVARKTGRDRKAVTAKRLRLGIAPTQPQGPWTDDEIALLGTNYDRVVAKQLGRKLSAVTMHRQKLGIPAYNQKRQRRTRGDAYLVELPEALTLSPRRFRQTLNRIWMERHGKELTTRTLAALSMWREDQIKAWLGSAEKMPPAVRHHLFVCAALLDLPALDSEGLSVMGRTRRYKRWTEEEIALLGTDADKNIAEKIGRDHMTVHRKRRELGIPSYYHPRFNRPGFNWINLPQSVIDRLGTVPDRILADEIGVSVGTIVNRRKSLGIPPFQKRRKRN